MKNVFLKDLRNHKEHRAHLEAHILPLSSVPCWSKPFEPRVFLLASPENNHLASCYEAPLPVSLLSNFNSPAFQWSEFGT